MGPVLFVVMRAMMIVVTQPYSVFILRSGKRVTVDENRNFVFGLSGWLAGYPSPHLSLALFALSLLLRRKEIGLAGWGTFAEHLGISVLRRVHWIMRPQAKFY